MTNSDIYDAAMGIVRNSSTRLFVPYDSAYPAILAAMQSVGIDVRESTNPIIGEAQRSLRKNRWSATVTAALRPETTSSTIVDWTVDMAGDKHPMVVAEILDAAHTPLDDLGLAEALARLNTMDRVSGWLEARSLTEHIRIDERVLELAQGKYRGSQGLLVLTTRRILFYDKGFKTSQVEEFSLSAISSISHSKRLGSEAIDITAAGRSAGIRQVSPGRGEAFVAAFHRTRSTPPTSRLSEPTSAADPVDQIRKLSELREAGVITEDEFTRKKHDLLDRM